MARKNQYPPRVWDRENETLSCGKCNTQKPYKEFSLDSNSKYGYGYWCKLCASENSRKHHKRRIESDAEYRNSKKNSYIKTEYGITLQQYKEKLEQQNNSCSICGVKLSAHDKNTHLDHDHKTGKLRDFLCGNCNRGIGSFHDEVWKLEKAIQYLNSHNSSVVTIKEVNVNESSH